jgi:hypothetical protein
VEKLEDELEELSELAWEVELLKQPNGADNASMARAIPSRGRMNSSVEQRDRAGCDSLNIACHAGVRKV